MATAIIPSPAKPTAGPVSSTGDINPSTPVSVSFRPTESDADLILIPSYSRWFSWKSIHECEVRFVPEFFDGKSPSKNPKAYKCYRNSIISRFRENPTRKITFTEVRKMIIADVGSIRRVFDFLETWGLINYVGGSNSKQQQQLKWEDKDARVSSDVAAAGGMTDVLKKKFCSLCKSNFTLACFTSEKRDMTLCSRCYVRGNYSLGLNADEFKRVEIGGEEIKTDWSDKETLQLLEAIMYYGDDWKKVSDHVGGRNPKECVARFIKLPFGEQFEGPPESVDAATYSGDQNAEKPSKKMRLSPLADASNPIMTQAAFLSTLVGVDVAEVAARAAVVALSEVGDRKHTESLKLPRYIEKGSDNVDSMDEAVVEAKLEIEKEELELEKKISDIAVEAKKLEEKIVHFEEFELQIGRKWQQFQQLQNLLFVDQLTRQFHKTNATTKTAESTGEVVKTG